MNQGSIAVSLSKTLDQLQYYIPEAILVVGLLLMVVIDLIVGGSKKWQGLFTLCILVCVVFSLATELGNMTTQVAMVIKVLLLIATGFCALLAMSESNIQKKSEHYSMMLGVLFGAFLLLNSQSLLTFYLGIEVMSISAYILTVMKLTKTSAEAGLKYLLFGATSSAIMLFGISLVYGFSGTIILADIDIITMTQVVGVYPTIIALGMMLLGLLFKVAAVPQHIWAPDVYQSAHTSVAAYFSIVPKIAGVIAFLVLIMNFNISESWYRPSMGIIAISTIVIGNFAALSQKDVKRMLAYSSIAHTGFLLIPVVLNTPTAWQSMLFYTVVYMIMNIAAFGLVMQMENVTGSTEIEKYRGMGKVMPFIGILVLIVMIALTGLPPTAGFTAKLFLFSSIWELYANSGDVLILSLLIVAVLNTVVSLFYYLKVPYYMFIKESNEATVKEPSMPLNYLLALLVLVLLVLFFKPDWLMELIYSISFGV